jgi:hypothetical protein
MARVQLIVAALALSLVAVSAIPVKLIKTEVVNKPAPKGCTLYNTSATCVDDKCGPFPSNLQRLLAPYRSILTAPATETYPDCEHVRAPNSQRGQISKVQPGSRGYAWREFARAPWQRVGAA